MLVVDDVADTGETLRLVLEKCRPAVDDVRAAVLYEKPRSVVRSDYVWRRTDRWIDFPWSSEPVIGRRRPRALTDHIRGRSILNYADR